MRDGTAGGGAGCCFKSCGQGRPRKLEEVKVRAEAGATVGAEALRHRQV